MPFVFIDIRANYRTTQLEKKDRQKERKKKLWWEIQMCSYIWVEVKVRLHLCCNYSAALTQKLKSAFNIVETFKPPLR